MNRSMLASIQEATRILQTRGPAEATAAIQRALQQIPSPLGECVEGHASSSSETNEALVLPEPPFRPAVSADVGRLHLRRTEVPPGEFLTGAFSNRAGAREYKLYVPSGHHAQALPLVVMLHGCTQTPDDFAAGTRMNVAAELQPCFVLYPAQAQRANGSRCWNWFKSGHQARDRGEPSIIGGMTREIIARYGVDPRRVYVAGMSAGGAMAAIMKSTHPDLFAAAGVHSGLPYGAAHDLPSGLEAMKGRPRSTAARPENLAPLIVFHGDGDKTVHPRNGDEILAQGVPKGSGSPTASSTEVQRGRVPNGRPFTRTLYRDRAGRVIAEHWVVHGAAHAWSGGSDEGSYVDPRGPDATREMLRFFSLWAQPES